MGEVSQKVLGCEGWGARRVEGCATAKFCGLLMKN